MKRRRCHTCLSSGLGSDDNVKDKGDYIDYEECIVGKHAGMIANKVRVDNQNRRLK